VLFPRDLVLRVGGLNNRNHYAMDYELWGRFLLGGATFCYTGIPFGCFRRHTFQKTQDRVQQTNVMLASAVELIADANCLAPEKKRQILTDLQAYKADYPAIQWRDSGRLARVGLPR